MHDFLPYGFRCAGDVVQLFQCRVEMATDDVEPPYRLAVPDRKEESGCKFTDIFFRS